jgi:hypothetical protein
MVLRRPFAEAGEVPDAAVVPGVGVAGCARNVFLKREAVVLGVVEVLLAEQDVGRERFGGHGGHVAEQCWRIGRRRCGSTADVVGGHAAVHEVLDEERFAIGRQRQPLRRATCVEAGDLDMVPGVHHGDGAAAFQRDEGEDAGGIVADRGGRAGVVEVDACRVVFC